jgi:hypothetical protein
LVLLDLTCRRGWGALSQCRGHGDCAAADISNVRRSPPPQKRGTRDFHEHDSPFTCRNVWASG